jgi:type I restriction enzyme R subunit
MPRAVVERWHVDLRDWLRHNGMTMADNSPLPSVDQVPQVLQQQFRKKRDRLFHKSLDECHGKCVLRRRELAEIVMNSLRHFDGQRYDLDSAIVMPNHVHVLVQFRPPTTCRAQCESWLHFTATRINRELGLKGAFWQSEPFDHLVRSVEQFVYLRRYIAENGIKAKLPDTDYYYWTNESRRGASCHTTATDTTLESS